MQANSRQLFDEVSSCATRRPHNMGSLALSAHRSGVRVVWMFQEQRTSPRVSMRAQVTCIVDSRTTRGVSWNLSQTGMQVEDVNLTPKEVVQLSFRLPISGVAVEAVGTVLWERNKRLGIRFIDVGIQSRRSISQYIEQHKEK